MKNLVLSFFILSGLILISCTKEPATQRYKYLTEVTWVSDTLFANGEDASDPGELLEKFKGEVVFRTNGTGVFGVYEGTWNLAYDDTQIMIKADSLPMRLVTQIIELNAVSLKITTEYPNVIIPTEPIQIRMTFNSK